MKLFQKLPSPDQFDHWVREHHQSLYRHALWMTGSSDLAVDMVQETYFQAWSGRQGLKDQSKVLPWLLTILRRRIYREHKCQYRHLETISALRLLDSEDDGSDPGSLLEIYRALENLSHHHREVFLLYHLHGFSYEEISDQLDIPKGTVMSRLARAREALSVLTTQDQSDKVVTISSRMGEVTSNDG